MTLPEGKPTARTAQWDVVIDELMAFQAIVRIRTSAGWTLHSWNIFIEMRGGGRITPYPTEMICSLWRRDE
jgi:hypothetical protein